MESQRGHPQNTNLPSTLATLPRSLHSPSAMTPSLSGRLKVLMLVALVTFGCWGCRFFSLATVDCRLKGNWEGMLNPAVFVDSSGNKSKGYLLKVSRAPEGVSLVKDSVLRGTVQLALAEWPAMKTKIYNNRFVIYTEENFAPGTRVRVRGEALSSTLLSKTGERLSSKDKPFCVLRVLKIEKIKLPYSPKPVSPDEPPSLSAVGTAQGVAKRPNHKT
jgi:hypothetical protein